MYTLNLENAYSHNVFSSGIIHSKCGFDKWGFVEMVSSVIQWYLLQLKKEAADPPAIR